MGRLTTNRLRNGTSSLFVWAFVACLTCSLLLHLLFLGESRSWVVPGFSAESYDAIVPRTFRMKRVEIDPKNLEEEKPEEKKIEHRPDIALPAEAPTAKNVSTAEMESPAMKIPKAAMPLENPQEKSVSLLDQALTRNKGKEDALVEGIEFTKKNSSAVELPEPRGFKDGSNIAGGGSSGTGERFSNLDDLLAGTGTVTAKTAPILMPTDLLFEYDSATLRPEAAKSLSKLGELIRKNSGADFRIEGHTDSFGSEEYNDQLSLRRAEAVRTWLLQNAGLEAKNMKTAGLGKRHLLVPANGSVAQQQLNRRVEIVITSNQG